MCASGQAFVNAEPYSYQGVRRGENSPSRWLASQACTPRRGALLLQMSAHDAVDGSCTGTQVPLMWAGLELALHRRGGRRTLVYGTWKFTLSDISQNYLALSDETSCLIA